MTLPRLIHHSHLPLGDIQNIAQVTFGLVRGVPMWGSKPEGLWVATDSGWAEYCISINRPLGAYHYEIVLAPDASILTLGSADEIDAFTLEYGMGNVIDHIGMPIENYSMRGMSDEAKREMEHSMCDWRTVAERWQGIVIHPHIRSRHNHHFAFWYYAWDVASGCIWDAAAVAEVRQLAPKVEATADGA